jgi:hypothetical protein
MTTTSRHADAPPTRPTAPTINIIINDTCQRRKRHQYADNITITTQLALRNG